MPLVGEQSWFLETPIMYDNYTRTASIDIPPSAAFLKVFLSHVLGNDDELNSAEAHIADVRFRNQSGVDQTVYVNGPTWYQPQLTHATIVVRVHEGYAKMLWTLGYWA